MFDSLNFVSTSSSFSSLSRIPSKFFSLNLNELYRRFSILFLFDSSLAPIKPMLSAGMFIPAAFDDADADVAGASRGDACNTVSEGMSFVACGIEAKGVNGTVEALPFYSVGRLGFV